MVRFQVRKREGQWEVWALLGRSWQLLDRFFSYRLAMTMATGQTPYGELDLVRNLRVGWL